MWIERRGRSRACNWQPDRLSRQRAPEAIGVLVAALADPDANIRWLAALTLQGIGGGTVIATLRTFIEQTPSALAREEATRLLHKLETP